jgi:hypothetical protein
MWIIAAFGANRSFQSRSAACHCKEQSLSESVGSVEKIPHRHNTDKIHEVVCRP